MRLKALLSRAKVPAAIQGDPEIMDPEIRWLAYDSRRVEKDSLFFAVRGERTDGHLYLEEARGRGAVAVVSEREPGAGHDLLPWVRVPAVRPVMAQTAAAFFDHPSRRLNLAGITGTNGKTTTAFLLHAMLNVASPAVLMGTIKTLLGKTELESERTTPEAIDIQALLARAVGEGCTRGALEVSSHALALWRVYQCHFPVAVFTNLTQDHLDFHREMRDYFEAKRLLFDPACNPGLSHAVVNADDAYARRIEAPPGGRRIGFSLSPAADVYPLARRISLQATEVDLHFFGRRVSLHSGLIGEHNVYNLMAAAAAAHLMGCSDEEIQRGTAALTSVPGRFERVDLAAPFTAVVDYAHTPHALENLLRLGRSLGPGRLICVFGCGGDRDRAKRPLMGRIAVEVSDWAIVTSDNPRSEPPEEIVEEIRRGIPSGFTNYEVIVDRRAAIARAIERAGRGDLVLIAGKGHETYQEVQGRRVHFDDREVVRELA